MSKYDHMEKSLNLPSLDDINNSYEEDEEENDEFLEEGFDEDQFLEPIDQFSNLTHEQLEEKLRGMQKKMNDFNSFSEMNSEITKQYNKDIDGLYNTALGDYKEIMSAALLMEPSQGAKFLAGAAKLLEIALRSKNSSMDKQLDMAKLQLEREKFQDTSKRKSNQRVVNTEDDDDQNENDYGEGLESYGVGENGGKIYDRNSLLKSIEDRRNSNSSNDPDSE